MKRFKKEFMKIDSILNNEDLNLLEKQEQIKAVAIKNNMSIDDIIFHMIYIHCNLYLAEYRLNNLLEEIEKM